MKLLPMGRYWQNPRLSAPILLPRNLESLSKLLSSMLKDS